MIEELLKIENVDINVKVDNWTDAITQAGKILLKNDKIEERYIEEMIKTVKEMGPYIVIVPGIAMPHARPECGVKELGLSIITLKNSVTFGNDEFDPVYLIFAICAKENKTHLELLQDLSLILDDPEILDNSKKCKTKEELIDLISNCYNKNK